MASNSGAKFAVKDVRATEFRFDGRSTVIGSETVTVVFRGVNGLVAYCYGTTVPTDTTAGYEVGCKFYKTDGTVGSVEYTNEGSTTSCDFNVVESAASTVTGVTAGTGMTGGGSSGTVTVNVAAGRGTAVRADNVDVGMDVYNATGGTLAVGTLVNLSGFDTTLGVTMTKADADAGVRATHVVLDAINNVTAGVVYPVGTAVNVNTGGRTIGDLVYLDNTTAGGFVFAAPTGADQLVQVVGIVKVVHATTGEIVFFPGSAQLTKLATSMLQDQAVTVTKLDSGMFAAGGGLIKDGSSLREGITIYNQTGGALTVGTLLHISSYTGTDGLVVTKADADAGIRATHVVLTEIANTTAGVVVPMGVAQNVNTGGRTIGDKVYVDNTTAGAFVFAAPTGADQMVQEVGVVKVVHATTGEIQFFPGLAMITKIPTSMLQDLAVSTGKMADGAVSYAKMQDISNTDRLLGRDTAAAGDPEELTVGGGLEFTGSGGIQSSAYTGDVTKSAGGTALTIAADAVNESKVADSAGTGTLMVEKGAIVVYDFAVDGGAQGAIPLTGSPTIPDNAVVWVDSYEVMITLTSASDAATLTLGFATDGNLFTGIAISDASNSWDAGFAVQGLKALTVASQTPQKLTAARTLQATVAGGENVTAGKVVFHLRYWVAQ